MTDWANIVSSASAQLQLATRYETVLLMGRECGKTVLSAYMPDVVDVQGTDSFADTARHVQGALVKLRERAAFPDFRGKILMRPEVWEMFVRPRVHWVAQHQVAHVDFPAAGGERFCDAAGRYLPGVTFQALEYIREAERDKSASYARWYGTARACSEFVERQTDLCYWVASLVPEDRLTYMRQRRLAIPEERALSRLGHAVRLSQQPLPYGLSKRKFIDYCELAGVWKRVRDYLVLAPPYAIGATYLKAHLTSAAIARTLSK